MEHQSEQSNTNVLCLNDDCLLQIFEFLELNDCMSVAETCSKFKIITQRLFRIKFAVKFNLISDGVNGNMYKYIDRIFFHLGSYLTSVNLWDFSNTEYVLQKIDKNSSKFYKKLKELILCLAQTNDFRNISLMSGLSNLEVLTLYQCDLRNDVDFFKHFCNLKYLNIEQCDNLHENALGAFFKNNPNMKGFALRSTDSFQFEALSLLVNLERFSLEVNFNGLNLSLLPKFHRLTKLKLGGLFGTSINDVLNELAKEGILDELSIGAFTFDDDTFVALKKLERLQLLVLTHAEAIKWNSSLTLPLNLKHLAFECYRISTTSIAAFIKQLPSLKNLNLRECKIVDRNGTRVSDFKNKCHQIANAMNRDDSQQIISVLIDDWIPTRESEEKPIDEGRLRCFADSKYLPNPDVFRVNFPGPVI